MRSLDRAGNPSATAYRVIHKASSAPAATAVSIKSNYLVNPSFARPGHTAIITFSVNKPVQTPVVTIAGHPAVVATTSVINKSYRATYLFTATDTEGVVPFSIFLTSTAGVVGTPATATTDSASVTFDKTPPIVSILNLVAKQKVSGAFGMKFSSNEAGTFQCRFDGKSFAVCTSPLSFSGLSAGNHTVYVRAIDRAGNAGVTVFRTFSYTP